MSEKPSSEAEREPLLAPVEKLIREKRYKEAVDLAQKTLEQLYSTQNESNVRVGIVSEVAQARQEAKDVPVEAWDDMYTAFDHIVQRLERIIRFYGNK